MRELRMVNGDVLNADSDGGKVPWCPECEAYAVPTDDGTCGECGTTVVYRDGS